MKILAKAGDDTIDLRAMSLDELYGLSREIQELDREVQEEINRWGTVRCYICEFDDLTYRGKPSVIWSKPLGYDLCPKCTIRYKNKFHKVLPVSPVDEVMALLD